MAKHRFRITVEPACAGLAEDGRAVTFIAESGDDILALIKRLGKTDDRELACLVGLKLLGEALKSETRDDMLDEFLPEFGDFSDTIRNRRLS